MLGCLRRARWRTCVCIAPLTSSSPYAPDAFPWHGSKALLVSEDPCLLDSGPDAS